MNIYRAVAITADHTLNGALTQPGANLDELLALNSFDRLLFSPLYRSTVAVVMRPLALAVAALYLTNMIMVLLSVNIFPDITECLTTELLKLSLSLGSASLLWIWLAPLLTQPISALVASCYTKILDDNYLVGRKLQNLSK